MEWSGKHDLVPAEKCLLLWNLGYQHPYRSKERVRKCMEPDSCRGLDHPKFKVNKKIHERQTDLAA